MNKAQLKIAKQVCLLQFLVVISIFLQPLRAQNTAFTYQGKLTDAGAAANGQYDLQFKLYDAPAAGNLYGTLTREDVQIANGIFTVQLDYGESVFKSGAGRYLEIAVRPGVSTGAFALVSPRQELTRAPYSIQAIKADALSINCISCVKDGQILSLDGSKVSGTVASAATAATAGNVSGIVAIANGGTGSTTKNFVDLNTAQTIGGDKALTGNLRANNFIRMGNEIGTDEAPALNPAIGAYNGLIMRRINSTNSAAGQVVARTNVLRLERDGTSGGWRISNDNLSSTAADGSQTVHCIGIDSAGNSIARQIGFLLNSAGTTQIFTAAQNIRYLQCTFGNPDNQGHQTQIVLQSLFGSTWSGTLTSTFNQ